MRDVAIAGLLGLLAAAPACAQTTGCLAPLTGTDGALTYNSPLSEPLRIGISRAVARTLQLTAAAADAAVAKPMASCIVGTLRTDTGDYPIHGGVGAEPLRWVRAEDQDRTIYLVPEPDEEGRDIRPYHLVEKNWRGLFDLQIYTGLPSEADVRRDMEATLEDDISPVAFYDLAGDAVTLFRLTKSQRTALLLGAAPTPDRPAQLFGADGDYFSPTREADVRMVAAGIHCPVEVGGMSRESLVVNDGDRRAPDLSCNYASGRIQVKISASRHPVVTVESLFSALTDGLPQNYKNLRLRPDVLSLTPGGPLSRGQAWLSDGPDGLWGGGVWSGMAGDYLLDVQGAWPENDTQAASAALQAVQALLSQGR